jgi:hypothetical protein
MWQSTPTEWQFGPVTAEAKAVETLPLWGDARGVLRRAEEGPLSPKAMKSLGRLSTDNWGRHRQDVARAQVLLGSHQDATDELTNLRETADVWLTHHRVSTAEHGGSARWFTELPPCACGLRP